MRMAGFGAEESIYDRDLRYQTRRRYTPSEMGNIGPAQRCPAGCYEANAACTGFVLWNTLLVP